MTESRNCLNDSLLSHENLGENSENKAFIEILGLLIISELGVINHDLGFLLIPTILDIRGWLSAPYCLSRAKWSAKSRYELSRTCLLYLSHN